MAQVTSKRNDSRPQVSGAVSHLQKVISVANGDASNGDNIEVLTFQNLGVVHRVSVRTSASLGASATVAAQHFDGNSTHTALTGATTAGAASKVDSDSNANVPINVKAGDKLELNVGGANITATATITVDLYLSA